MNAGSERTSRADRTQRSLKARHVETRSCTVECFAGDRSDEPSSDFRGVQNSPSAIVPKKTKQRARRSGTGIPGRARMRSKRKECETMRRNCRHGVRATIFRSRSDLARSGSRHIVHQIQTLSGRGQQLVINKDPRASGRNASAAGRSMGGVARRRRRRGRTCNLIAASAALYARNMHRLSF